MASSTIKKEEIRMNKAIIMDGKALAQKIKAGVKERIDPDHPPRLAVVMVGENPASQVYVRNKTKDCLECGIQCDTYHLPEDTIEKVLLDLIDRLNWDDGYNGILVQLPLPEHIDEGKILRQINPAKDVDGFHPLNVGLNRTSPGRGFAPCTPAGIMALLREYDIDPAGKHAVVVGRSNIVGKPMADLLLQADATVTICHSKTKNLKEMCQQADILVCAVGKAGFITADMVKNGTVVIDVGMNRNEEGKLCGDVVFEAVSEKASFITPVPGGVGPMTRVMLMLNTCDAHKKQYVSHM